MSGESVFPALEPLLEQVSKPIQYVGGELNSTVKDWDCGGFGPGGDDLTVRWALMYPDAYEVGVPNQGVMILYEVLNEREDALAERTYAVWPDLERLMRDAGVPQFTVDAHRSVRDFDLFGVSFSTELGYTNMLTALDLAGIPLHSVDRTDADPVVVAGGHAAFNPEPIADFVDAAIVGDGEEAVLAVTDIVTSWKAQGRPGGRRELLLRLARTGGVYVPSLYDVDYLPDGRIKRVAPHARGARGAVAGQQAHRHGPRRLAVPEAAAGASRRVGARADVRRDLPRLHPRLSLLPGRDDHPPGAGAFHHRHRRDGRARPRRHRVRGGRPVSLSSADHSEIADITKGLADRYEGTETGLSLPSTRVDAFNIDLANETHPQRPTLRPDLRARGWQRADPQGHQQDGVRGGPHLHRGRGVRRGLATGQALLHVRPADGDRRGRPADRRAGQEGHRDRPPGQRPPRHPLHRLDRRVRAQAAHAVPVVWPARRRGDRRALAKLRDALRSDRRYGSSIGFRYHDGKPGIVEGLLSRGDRRVGRVIEAVWRDGGRFDGWSEHFSYERWMRSAEGALADLPVDVAWYTTRERGETEVLPWDHIDSGLDKEWLWDDWQDALDETEVDDCRWTPCFDCGVCPQMGTEIETGPTGKTLLPLTVLGSGREQMLESGAHAH